ncbi:nuclear transport factor 2 family protein [Verrucosispora sp. WMMD1129]|uniref:nuclear transport factor 2 family protein n=1 Tax=Verrucosispora sp. WMMD1129 TaxID=3016093 RepID=UPI00249A06A9|nr:nuclear transport factor 2 family protein [Verrucosispora sp. WMMD1129]WFE47794.1 nuclear transport factor 2 family protein [Verrucosispora sp. WMMD1129]
MDANVTAYLMHYPQEVTFGEDAATVFDRYHTPDFVMCNDGIHLDRERLLAHVRPARKRATSVRVEVHETVNSAERVAARYTLTADMATGKTIATEIYMFGQLSADGRLRRIDQVTRDVSPGR